MAMLRKVNVDLAFSRPLVDYTPQVSDFVIWSGWLTSWFGMVLEVDTDGTMKVAFSGSPSYLFTMTPAEQLSRVVVVKLADVMAARFGVWAILRHDTTRNQSLWYI